MNGRRTKPTPPITSPIALRAIVAGITFTAFTGASAFAATHIQNPAAPLKPPADGTTSGVATAAPAPTARTRNTNTGTVPTTTAAPRTRTRRS